MNPTRRSSSTACLGVVLVLLAAGPAGQVAGQPVDGVEGAEARLPVVLVPGWGDEATGVAPIRDRLIEVGWPEDEVFALSFQDPWGSNEAHALEVQVSVEAMIQHTGQPRVDVVAHSMGGLAVREFLGSPAGAGVVRRAVFLGTPHRGTVAAILAWGDGGREMAPGSDFLARLNAREPPEGVEMLSVRSSVDLRVIPGSSAMLPHAHNVEICCPSHQGMVDDDRTFEEIVRFLRSGPEQLTTPDGTIPLRTDPWWWRESFRDR